MADLPKPPSIAVIFGIFFRIGLFSFGGGLSGWVYRDVVVQISDDPAFSKDVTTVYDNSAAGKDRAYIESYYGKIIDAKGAKGRYVRLYSNGNTSNKLNHYIEVEVFGKPAA